VGSLNVRAEPEGSHFTIVCTANLQGVLEPCGCQSQQGGGLARQVTVLKGLRSTIVSPVVVDAGNLVAKLAPRVDTLQLARSILHEGGWSASVVGPSELGLAGDALDRGIGDARLPTLASNVHLTSGRALGVPVVDIDDGPARLTFLSVLGTQPIKSEYVYAQGADAISDRVRQATVAGRIPVLVSFQPLAELDALLGRVSGVGIVLSHSSEAPAVGTRRSDGTWIVRVPASSKEIRILDVELGERGTLRLNVRTEDLPASVTPDPAVHERIHTFYEQNRIVALPGASRISVQSLAAGKTLASASTRECGSCHRKQLQQWFTTKHAHAWGTLQVNKAQNRPECIGCHTTPLAAALLGSAESGVGCRSCHGSGLEHAANPKARGAIQARVSENLCRGCHTLDSSPYFEFRKYLKLVSH
jgi:hypothetical protein